MERKRTGSRPKRSGGGKRRPPGQIRGRLRPHDPFELIRWLALSQPDPRKALAELVQNSLDASATRIRVTRRRERKAPCLFINDDGEGIIPEMDRPEALRYIATHVGHSRKRSLSPQQRLELMTQGQFGIGLLGFWSLGEILEVRTAMPGQRAHRLILHRDRPDYEIEPLRGRLELEEKWTEIVIVGLHREAQAVLIGRRAADYLGSELRGQLLARPVDLVVEDRMSRGRAQKVIEVRPPRFLGERLEGIGPLEVPGHSPVRFEIYLAGERREGEAEPTGLALYSAGSLVAESFHDLATLNLDHTPWTDTQLSGIVDFPSLHVAPGSRRGVVADETAGAFARALESIEPILIGLLDALDRRRAEEIDRTVIRDLQRAFRDFHRFRPGYAMLPVANRGNATTGASVESESGDESGAVAEGTATDDAASESTTENRRQRMDLLPAGPLDCVKLTPTPMHVECQSQRGARARALDVTGRPVEAEVEYDWSIAGPIGELIHDDLPADRVLLSAGDTEATGVLSVVARAEGREARAETEVEVLAEILAGRGSEGIPDPKLVYRTGVPWRSRMENGAWEVNTAHRDYRAIADLAAPKLRYLAMLFAKEIVVRSHQDPRLEPSLEQLVEVASYADRKLASRRRGRARARKKSRR